LNVSRLRSAIVAGRYEWRKHALERLAERGISQEWVLEVLDTGELIEDYPEDTPHPGALFLGWVQGRPLHVVAAMDDENDWAYIITTYKPDDEHFEPDSRTRRSR